MKNEMRLLRRIAIMHCRRHASTSSALTRALQYEGYGDPLQVLSVIEMQEKETTLRQALGENEVRSELLLHTNAFVGDCALAAGARQSGRYQHDTGNLSDQTTTTSRRRQRGRWCCACGVLLYCFIVSILRSFRLARQ